MAAPPMRRSSSPYRATPLCRSLPPRRAMPSSAATTGSTAPRWTRPRIRQNDRLVVTLKVTETEAKMARLLLVDLLPAGLEIDNPSLVDSTGLAGLPWLKRDVEPAPAEYRDDRFVAAIDRQPRQPAFFTLAYVVRAVAPGPLRASPCHGGGHVPTRALRPHGLRHGRGRGPAMMEEPSPETQATGCGAGSPPARGAGALRRGVGGGAALWRFVDAARTARHVPPVAGLDRRARSRRPAAARLHHGRRPLALAA